MRSKEESEDYRYFQEPDLLPLHIDAAWRQAIRSQRPTLPAEKRAGYVALGAGDATAALLADSEDLGQLFTAAVAGGADARSVGNWLTGEVVAYLRSEDTTIDQTGLAPEHLAELGMLRAGMDVLPAVRFQEASLDRLGFFLAHRAAACRRAPVGVS